MLKDTKLSTNQNQNNNRNLTTMYQNIGQQSLARHSLLVSLKIITSTLKTTLSSQQIQLVQAAVAHPPHKTSPEATSSNRVLTFIKTL